MYFSQRGKVFLSVVKSLWRLRRLPWFLLVALPLLATRPWLSHLLAREDRLVDLVVYRAAGVSLLDGRPLYEHLTGAGLPFTYPPFAALLCLPLVLIPIGPLGVVWTIGNVVLLVRLLARHGRAAWSRLGPLGLGALAAALVWTLPVRDTLRFGQVNLMLMALVVADVAGRDGRRSQGALVGLAAAVKLTPAFFVPYLWLSGRRRAALTAVGTFIGLTAVGALLLPAQTRRFWLDGGLDTARVGSNRGPSNQSIRGFLLRLDLPPTAVTVTWIALAALVSVVAWRRATALSRDGDELAALAVVGCGSVLVSPVSWVHHAVWLVLAVVVLLRPPWRRRTLLAAVALVVVLLPRLPWWAFEAARDASGPVVIALRVVGASVMWCALAVVIALPARVRAPRDGGGLARAGTAP